MPQDQSLKTKVVFILLYLITALDLKQLDTPSRAPWYGEKRGNGIPSWAVLVRDLAAKVLTTPSPHPETGPCWKHLDCIHWHPVTIYQTSFSSFPDESHSPECFPFNKNVHWKILPFWFLRQAAQSHRTPTVWIDSMRLNSAHSWTRQIRESVTGFPGYMQGICRVNDYGIIYSGILCILWYVP